MISCGWAGPQRIGSILFIPVTRHIHNIYFFLSFGFFFSVAADSSSSYLIKSTLNITKECDSSCGHRFSRHFFHTLTKNSTDVGNLNNSVPSEDVFIYSSEFVILYILCVRFSQSDENFLEHFHLNCYWYMADLILKFRNFWVRIVLKDNFRFRQKFVKLI